MAEYVVAFLLDRIANHLIEEADLLSNVRGQVEWIEGELRRMQCFLKDADMKQDGDERVKNWVAEIRSVANDTDVVIDSYILQMAQQRRRGVAMLLKRHLFFWNELILTRRVQKQIKRIRTRIQDITNSRSSYAIENIGKRREEFSFASQRFQEKRRSYPHDCDEDIVGMEEDLRAIEMHLIHGESRRSVISVVGMGGIGKTTLAKKIFLNSDVTKHFDCCAWVFVSQEYRPKDTLQELGKRLIGLVKGDMDSVNNSDLLETISKFLAEKRYVIVLDDVWKCEVWDDLKSAFPDTNNGSRVILTTRSKYVGLYADPLSIPHELCPLNDKDSWELFSKKVCLQWYCSSLPPWTEELGKEIVSRCQGLPLAIVVLAGLLSRKDATYNEWLKVLRSVHWQLRQDPMQCAEILELSYTDLPYYLKSCFLYLGLFPETFEISARRLIMLWVAEGFLQPRDQEPLEDIAEDYLEELIARSMVQVAKRKSNGRIKTCRVHDILRELAISKGKEYHFLDVIHEEASAGVPSRGSRLAIHHGDLSISKRSPKLRTLLCFNLNETFVLILKKLKLLRVLDLEGVYLARLNPAIGNLLHLRFLGLRGTWLKKLPQSVSYLLNLQTLDLRSTLISPIPVAIWELQSLRNLYFSKLKEMSVNPPMSAIGPVNLQTLRGIFITQRSRIENGLDKLTNLKELGLLGDLWHQEKALANWICLLKNLECLKLSARHPLECTIEDVTVAPIPKLTFKSHIHLYKLHLTGGISKLYNVEDFPPNLSELSLKGSYLMEDPMPKLQNLPSLRVLKLKNGSYVGKELVCSAGGFPQLQYLKLSFLPVMNLRIEEGAFSNLRQLDIIECRRVKIVPRGLQPVTTLKDLKLGYIQPLFEMKVQDREGEDWYKIHHVLPL